MNLAGAQLSGAYLSGADLADANLAGAQLSSADLSGAHLNGTILTGAKWPADAPVPEGWKRDAGSGRLRAAGTEPETAEAN